MNKIYNYFLLIILACVNVCCSESELLDTPTQAKPGEEVQFGLSLVNDTRTIYGSEGQYENNEGTTVHAFPLYWDDDDEVLVASPQCSRKEAKYKVTPASGCCTVAEPAQNPSSNSTRFLSIEGISYFFLSSFIFYVILFYFSLFYNIIFQVHTPFRTHKITNIFENVQVF